MIARVFVRADQEALLLHLGICNSKTLSNIAIAKFSEQIVASYPGHMVIVIETGDDHQQYAQHQNLYLLLAEQQANINTHLQHITGA